jgi:hypothetical protein
VDDQSAPVRVRSIDEEDTFIGACACGGAWRLSSNAVYPRARLWLDSVQVACPSCGRRAAYVFDISGFFEPRPGIWSPIASGWAAPNQTPIPGRQARGSGSELAALRNGSAGLGS